MVAAGTSRPATAERGGVLLAYAICLALVFLALWSFPAAESALETRSRSALPDLVVHGVGFPGSDALPPFRAERAVPVDPAVVLTIAGLGRALALTAVEVELGEGCWLRAEEGRYDGRRLELRGRVTAPAPPANSGTGLVAGAAVLAGGRIRLPGLALFTRGSRTIREVDLDTTPAALRERLR
jgi:hypothetical protein